MRYLLHPEASAELEAAAGHYAEHASPLIAEAFLLDFERTVDLLIASPLIGSAVGSGLRLLHFARFPYSIIYETVEPQGLQIHAVAHQHRQPGYWSDRR